MKKAEKLRKNIEFRRVYKKGKSCANKLLVLYVLKNNMNNNNDSSKNRLGISVSKKVGNSVTRSRIKRLISESYRLNREQLKIKNGYDLVFIARNNSKDKTYKEIENSVLNLLKRAGLYNK